MPEGHVPLNKVLTVPIIVSNDIKAVIGVANKKTDYGSDDIIQMELLSDTLWTVVGRKEQNMHLVQAKEKAEESDRLKSAFLANMSHEIRTPINGIMGFAEMLRQNVSIGEKQEFIDVIKKSGVRMLNTIDDLMDISLIEAGQIEVLMSAMNMNELVGELHLFFQPEVNAKGLELKYSMP
ncbi:MAG TPA: histidine kinase dimerization/phospho-acceptor domain-containing protein, partial [Prolixibacteraceae bacterium]|nr:histidine kinase dimerization/phospho-acceptor domain-containing protein [Prolixibacteraceae bacterium]